MNINSLHEHNREAYLKVMQHFDEGHQKACVVHATGTGKSYIIAAVTDHYERVLILTTNMFVIEQVSSTIKTESPQRTTEPTFMIYQGLLQQMKDKADYTDSFDLIVFDEFHHGGAEEWGKAVDWILQQNPSAKVLGTSATSIRHSDNRRDMGEEMFEGNVISTLSLGEAWARKILMAPYYIMAVEDSDQFYNDFIRKIEESNLFEDKKTHYREMAKNIHDRYQMEKNAPDIIRKWLPADSRRVIVFSKDIEEAESNLAKVKKWMKKAGFTVADVYIVHSKRPFEEKKRQMQLFQDDDFTGIKVMVAVDMLNEGVHIPRVDSVFFLRKTQSPTIHLQQMGRCMGTYKENGRRPVVFDFRNNVENTRRAEHTGSFFGEAAKDYDAWKDLEEENLDTQVIREQNKTERVRENFPDGINYTMDYGIMIDRFGEDLSNANWDANYAEAKAFFDEHGHFPTYKENIRLKGWAVKWWVRVFLTDRTKNQKKAVMLTAIGFVYQSSEDRYNKMWWENYEEVKAFFDEHGHFPTYDENERLNGWSHQWWKNTYLKNPELCQEKADMLTAIGFVYQSSEDRYNKMWWKNYEEAKVFYEEHGHFPTEGESKKLNAWAKEWWKGTYKRTKIKYQEKTDMLTAIGFTYKSKDEILDKKWMKCYEEAEAFFEEHGHFPTNKENERLNAWAMNWWRKTYLKNPELCQEKADMLTAIGFVYQSSEDRYNKMWWENYEEAKVFYEEHGHFPTEGESKKLNAWANNWVKKSSNNNPEKLVLLQDIGFTIRITQKELFQRRWYNQFIKAKSFFEVHKRFPKYSEETKIYAWSHQWWKNTYLKNPEIHQEKAEMLMAIGFVYKGEK